MTTKGSDGVAWAVSSMPLFDICMTAWELDCMEIGLHGNWTVCVLGLEPLHGRSQTDAGEEDCMLEQRIVTL